MEAVSFLIACDIHLHIYLSINSGLYLHLFYKRALHLGDYELIHNHVVFDTTPTLLTT